MDLPNLSLIGTWREINVILAVLNIALNFRCTLRNWRRHTPIERSWRVGWTFILIGVALALVQVLIYAPSEGSIWRVLESLVFTIGLALFAEAQLYGWRIERTCITPGLRDPVEYGRQFSDAARQKKRWF